MIVWDLDGTLVDTRKANLYAYESIGVTPPVDFDTRPWQDWCTEKDHNRKSDVIHLYLDKYARPTVLMPWYRQVGGTVLTNASWPVVKWCFEKFDLAPVLHGYTPNMKVEWLAARPPGVYLDDSKRTIELVRRKTNWCAVQVRF